MRRYTTPNENFEYGYPNSNVLFNFYTSKTLYFVQNVSFVSDVNHYVDQSLATLLLTSGFRPYIAGYTVTNSWRYPIRRRVIITSALELVLTVLAFRELTLSASFKSCCLFKLSVAPACKTFYIMFGTPKI